MSFRNSKSPLPLNCKTIDSKEGGVNLSHQHHAWFVKIFALVVDSLVPDNNCMTLCMRQLLKFASSLDAVAGFKRSPHIICIVAVNVVEDESSTGQGGLVEFRSSPCVREFPIHQFA
jgi:hypothetical protein